MPIKFFAGVPSILLRKPLQVARLEQKLRRLGVSFRIKIVRTKRKGTFFAVQLLSNPDKGGYDYAQHG